MAGIYLHIPFCRKACHYCDFHFSTSFKTKSEVLQSMVKEIQSRAHESDRIDSIYFGGGTPSILNVSELNLLLSCIKQTFSISNACEITLEANPDDLNPKKLAELYQAGINRLSIGIQSFFEEDLNWMNRTHNAEQALHCVTDAHKAGIKNISIDLIFGYPLLTQAKWESNLQRAFSLPIQHLSCYSMTVELGTALYHQIKQGQTPPPVDENANSQYEYLMDEMAQHGWEHYEISNFAKPGHHSKHNSSYWSGQAYIGIGPGAHGFTGKERYWNPAHNIRYLQAWQENNNPEEIEVLEAKDLHNEFILTQLRQSKGIDQKDYQARFSSQQWQILMQEADEHLKTGHLQFTENQLSLTRQGKKLADSIISDLFQVEA